jgi:hypothetical protein
MAIGPQVFLCFGYLNDWYETLDEAMEHCRLFGYDSLLWRRRTFCIRLDLEAQMAQVVYLQDNKGGGKILFSPHSPALPSAKAFASIAKKVFYKEGDGLDIDEESFSLLETRPGYYLSLALSEERPNTRSPRNIKKALQPPPTQPPTPVHFGRGAQERQGCLWGLLRLFS